MTHSVSSYVGKAEKALSAARLLLNADDADGACNRAYYAMFDMAHAALIAADVELPQKPVKTHNGLIALFGQHLVRTNQIDSQHGVAFNKVQNFRLVADYEGGVVSIVNARWAVEHADAFVAAIKLLLDRPR